jgi:hypothetical protein
MLGANLVCFQVRIESRLDEIESLIFLPIDVLLRSSLHLNVHPGMRLRGQFEGD